MTQCNHVDENHEKKNYNISRHISTTPAQTGLFAKMNVRKMFTISFRGKTAIEYGKSKCLLWQIMHMIFVLRLCIIDYGGKKSFGGVIHADDAACESNDDDDDVENDCRHRK